MPSLITAAAVKADFPVWASFLKTGPETPEQLDASLDARIAEAETQLLEYLPALTPTTLTDPLRLHLLVLVRKRCFDVRHGNTAFQVKPQIVRDYEDTLKMLERYRSGEFGHEADRAPDGSTDTFTLNAKPRRFDGWFLP